MKRRESDDTETDKVVPIRPGVTIQEEIFEYSGQVKSRAIAKAVAKGALETIKAIIFIVLLWLRLPIRLILIAISVMTLIGIFFSWVFFSDFSMVPGFVLMGLTSTALAWFYDVLLIRLSPGGVGVI